MKTEREAKEESTMIGALLVAGFIISLMLGLTGCSGGRVYLGYERVDEYQRTESMKPTPWKCLFVTCEGESHGS